MSLPGLAESSETPESQAVGGHNIADSYLQLFRSTYSKPDISKDDIWQYIYGVMHSPDWREKYASDLKKNLPRIPLATDFEAFRSAGQELMDLHADYETCPELETITIEVNKELVDEEGVPVGSLPDITNQESINTDIFKIRDRMRWGATTGDKTSDTASKDNKTDLRINDNCVLRNIPPEAHKFKVSGRSPLEWAVESLRHKKDTDSSITDDPNGWDAWVDEPFELIRHLRRLAWLGVRSTEIIENLPPSLDGPQVADLQIAGMQIADIT